MTITCLAISRYERKKEGEKLRLWHFTPYHRHRHSCTCSRKTAKLITIREYDLHVELESTIARTGAYASLFELENNKKASKLMLL